MTSDEIRSMLERQLVRLERMSETTTHPRALTGMTGSMLAISRRLEQIQACSKSVKEIDLALGKAHRSAKELSEVIGNRFDKDDPLYQQTKRVADNIESIGFMSYVLMGTLRGDGGKDA